VATALCGISRAAYALAGTKDDAEKVLGQLKDLLKGGYASPYSIVVVYAGLNQNDVPFSGWGRPIRTVDYRTFYLERNG